MQPLGPCGPGLASRRRLGRRPSPPSPRPARIDRRFDRSLWTRGGVGVKDYFCKREFLGSRRGINARDRNGLAQARRGASPRGAGQPVGRVVIASEAKRTSGREGAGGARTTAAWETPRFLENQRQSGPISASDGRRWPNPRQGGPSAPASGGFGLDQASSLDVSRRREIDDDERPIVIASEAKRPSGRDGAGWDGGHGGAKSASIFWRIGHRPAPDLGIRWSSMAEPSSRRAFGPRLRRLRP
jgi:hypothetical protein